MTIEKNKLEYPKVARQFHCNCVVCAADDPFGLGLQFQAGADGSMVVKFQGGMQFQGYSDRLHGGIIALLFDAAMTHCLFARDLTGVTAELNVRFRLPVSTSRAVTVRAWVEKQKSHLYLLKATLEQDGELKSTAEAKFWLDSHAGERLGQTMF